MANSKASVRCPLGKQKQEILSSDLQGEIWMKGMQAIHGPGKGKKCISYRWVDHEIPNVSGFITLWACRCKWAIRHQIPQKQFPYTPGSKKMLFSGISSGIQLWVIKGLLLTIKVYAGGRRKKWRCPNKNYGEGDCNNIKIICSKGEWGVVTCRRKKKSARSAHIRSARAERFASHMKIVWHHHHHEICLISQIRLFIACAQSQNCFAYGLENVSAHLYVNACMTSQVQSTRVQVDMESCFLIFRFWRLSAQSLWTSFFSPLAPELLFVVVTASFLTVQLTAWLSH